MSQGCEGSDLGRDGAGERVVREIEREEPGGVEETGRDGLGEVVVGERESFEGVEEAELGGDVAGEALVGEGEARDAVASAHNAGPVAGGRVGLGPGLEDAGRVEVDGCFESEEGEAVGGERGREWSSGEEEECEK